jgi:hypothetical protein
MSADPKILPMRPALGRQIEYEIKSKTYDYCKDEIEKEKEIEKDHPAIDISISLEDSVHWFCSDMKFRVLSVHPGKENPDAPVPLFYRRFPEDDPEFANHVNSGPARRGTENNVYKPIFEFQDGHTLDPHIRTNK